MKRINKKKNNIASGFILTWLNAISNMLATFHHILPLTNWRIRAVPVRTNTQWHLKSVPSVESGGTESRAPEVRTRYQQPWRRLRFQVAHWPRKLNQWRRLCASAHTCTQQQLSLCLQPPVYIDKCNGNMTEGLSLRFSSLALSVWLKAIKPLKWHSRVFKIINERWNLYLFPHVAHQHVAVGSHVCNVFC